MALGDGTHCTGMDDVIICFLLHRHEIKQKKNVIFLWVSTYCVSPGASHAFHFLLFFLKPSAILFLYFIVEMLKKQKMIVDRVTRFFFSGGFENVCAA